MVTVGITQGDAPLPTKSSTKGTTDPRYLTALRIMRGNANNSKCSLQHQTGQAQILTLPAMGLDVVGSLSRAQSQMRFLLVAIDYFTKWIEAVPVFEVSGQQIVKLLR